MFVTVQLVCVPPMQQGYGLGQTDDGRIVRFSATRKRLVHLCATLREAHLQGGDWPRIRMRAHALTDVSEESPDYETWHLAHRYR